MARTKAEKQKIEAISQELIEMIGEFCDQYLDEDYSIRFDRQPSNRTNRNVIGTTPH